MVRALEFDHEGLPVGMNGDVTSSTDGRAFCPWRVAREPTLQAYVAEVADLCACLMESRSDEGRARALRDRDGSHRDRVERIICDLVYAAASRTLHLSIERTGKGQGGCVPDCWSRKAPSAILGMLNGLSVLVQSIGRQGQPTTIRPGPALEDAIAAHGWGRASVASGADRPCVMLLSGPRRKAGRVQVFSEVRCDGSPDGTTVEAEMAELNRLLAEAARSGRLRCTGPMASALDGSDTHLTRVFYAGRGWRPGQPQRFDLNGSLEGGFWQELSPAERRARLRIDGDRIEALEVDLPLFQLSGRYDAMTCARDAEAARTYARILFAPELPKRAVRELRKALDVKPLPEPEAGWSLLGKWTNIVVTASRRCARAGVVALPTSGGVIVARHDFGTAWAILADSFQELTGLEMRGSYAIPQPSAMFVPAAIHEVASAMGQSVRTTYGMLTADRRLDLFRPTKGFS